MAAHTEPATPHRIDQMIEEAIATSPYVARSKVNIEQRGGHVTLRGTVDSYFQKQMAQETLRRIDGVARIDNRLVVAAANCQTGGGRP